MKPLTFIIGFCIVFLTVAHVYEMGVKHGQLETLKTAYEVCRKVAPLNDGIGCK